MNTVQSKDGTAIAYDQTGSGPPLILVGGAFSYRKFPGAIQLAELLAPHFTVINYDRRGRGDSGDTAPYAVEREIEDLDALIAAVGGSARVWGNSSGAALALMAVTAGSKISKLALYEPPYMVGTVGHRPPPDYKQQLAALVGADKRGEAVKYFLTQIMGAPAFIALVMRFTPFWPRLKATAHTLPYELEIMGDFSFPAARVASVRVPSLIMAGEKSPEVLRSAAKAVAETLPGVKHHVLMGQSHNVSMKALAPVLIEFFAN